MKLASLSPLHVLTPVSGCPAYRLANCRLSGISSPTNSCHSPILNLYSPKMTCVPLTIHSAKSPNPVVLFQIHHHLDPPVYQDKDEEHLPIAPAAPSAPVQPTLSPPAPLELTTVPSDDVLIQRLMFCSVSRLPRSSLRSRAPMFLLLTKHRVPPHVHLRNPLTLK